MFSLNGAVKYKYIPNYQDMRGGYVLFAHWERILMMVQPTSLRPKIRR